MRPSKTNSISKRFIVMKNGNNNFRLIYYNNLISISLSLFLLFITPLNVTAQLSDQLPIKLQWNQPDTLVMPGYNPLVRLHFEEASYGNMLSVLPVFATTQPIFDANVEVKLSLEEIITEDIPANQLPHLQGLKLNHDFQLQHAVLVSRGTPYLRISVTPIRVKDETYERLVTANLKLEINYKTEAENNLKSGNSFANESVLASGNWYKLRIPETGIYRLSAADLQAMGIATSSLNPRNIRIYGNGGGLLPENNQAFRHDDLVENPIVVVGEDDGVFNDNDYVLFYAQGPMLWEYNERTSLYERQNNAYDNYSHVFVNVDRGPGKRIQTQQQATGTPAKIITDFPDYLLHEEDIYNLTNTGRTWYGDLFDVSLTKNFNFNFPGIVSSKPAHLAIELAGRVLQGSAYFQLYVNGNLERSLPIASTSPTGYDFARQNQASFNFNASSDQIDVQLKFNRSVNSARGWIDYIAINAWRSLRFNGSQLHFRNPEVLNPLSVVEYRVANSNTNLQVWEVTNPVHVSRIAGNNSGSTFSYKAGGGEHKKFIAFDGSSFLKAEFVELVENQNLHAVRDIDYLIISHPDFLDQANRLANIHRNNNNMVVYITTPDKIFNEFSAGSVDVTAIRDFNRMLYSQSSPGRELRYLLLFGDASFDYKNRSGTAINYVPTTESISSLNLVNSIASDDYYGYLDLDEGSDDSTSNNPSINLLDIGIGRFPVSTVEQATQMVDKVVSYLRKDEATMRPWRNFITFIADDADQNLHLSDAEKLYTLLDQTQKAVNFDKIYLDAYPQIPTPGGQKAPAVNEAINRRMDKGSLIMNYSGHGGEVGWAEERILSIADIQSWRNKDMLPVFITATCEFSRYDDHTRTSAGELVILNPVGGAIAMFTTARATYASANLALNRAIYKDNMFQKINGEYPRFGDIIRKSKLNGGPNDRKFVLLGDPALQLAYPSLKVETTHINGEAVSARPDTLKALDQVQITGQVTDENGQLISNYNGVVHITIYDKASTITTAGDENGYPTTFELRNSVIYKGKASVTQGKFDFSFMLPKDIAYNYGEGRISYYATDYHTDANGYYENILIGGFNDEAVIDGHGPKIRLFMNDTTFVDGGTTNESPTLLGFVTDENGINTTGAGIGHDITAQVSGSTLKSAILNDYYEAEIGRSASGMIKFPLSGLNPGTHTLTLKVWDVFNNSSEATISFVVVNSTEMHIESLYNYPNPFIDETFFVFDHNQAGMEMAIDLQIFDLSGRLVKQMKGAIKGTAFRSEPIRWDGTSDSGQKLPKGLYIYRLNVTNEKGQQAQKNAKLIFYR
ncbi:MAG: type IX secretion system sortase PorU [Bacteroidales bacterium]|jgi:hypothetical protein|nr:type IX secretion system sortase PorU [Bacteroidales bacterium]